jgi:hypothetical protein
VAKIMRDAVSSILKNGYNPFNDEPTSIDEVQVMNVPEAVEFVLELKKSKISPNSYQDLRIRLKSFEKWLLGHGFENRYIISLK